MGNLLLVKGCFQFNRMGPFGLMLQQYTERLLVQNAPGFIQNAGWINMKGGFLGWGDITPSMLARISWELAGRAYAGEPEELFIVLNEHDWRHGPDSTQWVRAEQFPLEYVAERVRAISAPGVVYWVDYPVHGQYAGARSVEIRREEAKILILGNAKRQNGGRMQGRRAAV